MARSLVRVSADIALPVAYGSGASASANSTSSPLNISFSDGSSVSSLRGYLSLVLMAGLPLTALPQAPLQALQSAHSTIGAWHERLAVRHRRHAILVVPKEAFGRHAI